MKKSPHGEDLLDDSSNYDKDYYPKAANTVDICICSFVDSKLNVLLIKRKNNPDKGLFAIPGGYVDIADNESLEDSALRELKEETGVTGIPVQQLKTYGDPSRDPRDRTITTVYYALVKKSMLEKQKIEAESDTLAVRWFPLEELPEKMAFDHRRILDDLYTRVQGRMFYTGDPFLLAEDVFTLPELKKIYENILGEKIDNFSRKINKIYKIQESMADSAAKKIGRPSKKYIYMGLKKLY